MRFTHLAYDSQTKLRALYHYWLGAARADSATGRSRLAGPLTVQVQTVDRCPAACVMCPNASSPHRGPARTIDDGVYAQVLSALRQPGTVRRLTLMLQNEPLLDEGLERRIRAARDALGAGVEIGVVTNGALLTRERVRRLFGAGLSRLSVSLDALTAETYAAIRTGLDFTRITREVESVIEDYPRRAVIVRFLRQRANWHEEHDFVRHWKSRGAGVYVSTVVNRAGSVEAFHGVQHVERRPLHRVVHGVLRRVVPWCPLPFMAMAVLADGRAILCCHDWGPRAVVGSFAEQPLAAIWNGASLCGTRRGLMARPSSEMEPCAACSLRAGLWSPGQGAPPGAPGAPGSGDISIRRRSRLQNRHSRPV